MLAAVIPVKNEAATIKKVIISLLALKVDLIIPVLNGCTDSSFRVVMKIQSKHILPLYFKEP